MNTAEAPAAVGHNSDNRPFEDMSRDEQILAWQEAKKQLDALKESEMAMRKHIVASQFDADKIGAQNVELGKGWKLKAVTKVRYNVDRDTDKVDNVLDQLEDWQADRLVKWKPELSVSEYKKLDDEDRAKVDAIVTIVPSSPELSLVPPKGA